jgi:site-specific DNA-methyltransferase (adenine-specific)
MNKCLADFEAVKTKNATVFHGSNLDVLPFMADNSVDAIVTDPPYELGFMGKSWDSTGIAYSVELWRECLRVLKPGGHILAFGGSRTWHRLAVAIEDAGFELRDSIAWLYGSGFPKSHDVSKAIDKAANAERVLRINEKWAERYPNGPGGNLSQNGQINQLKRITGNPLMTSDPITDDAKKWVGWGTALKPAFEPVVVGRKPLIGTVAANVLEWGVGGLNIDGSRIGMSAEDKEKSANNWKPQGYESKENIYDIGTKVIATEQKSGRWPANIILDEYTAGLLDEQAPNTGSWSKAGKANGNHKSDGSGEFLNFAADDTGTHYGDMAGASRFFYVAKASKRDRNEGLEDFEPQRHADRVSDTGIGGDNPRNRSNHAKQNFHPTVKPTDLMRYLIKLVTPAGGLVLDPFTGSGSTGKAALLDGYKFLGIEMTAEYLPIIQGRLDWAEQQTDQAEEKESETLF